VERLDLVLRRADDDDRVVHDLVDVEVAHVRDVVQAAGVLPDLRPELLLLELGELGGDVSLRRDVLRTEVLVRLGEEGLRDGLGLGLDLEDVLDGPSSEPGVTPCLHSQVFGRH
jgi:hypothetical protein